MRISVSCNPERDGEQEPCVFHLGGRRLCVLSILERWTEQGCRYFEVRVEDGRRFVLRLDGASGQWELAAVYAASRPSPAGPAPASSRKRWFAR